MILSFATFLHFAMILSLVSDDFLTRLTIRSEDKDGISLTPQNRTGGGEEILDRRIDYPAVPV
jgi:hypothetical protein